MEPPICIHMQTGRLAELWRSSKGNPAAATDTTPSIYGWAPNLHAEICVTIMKIVMILCV